MKQGKEQLDTQPPVLPQDSRRRAAGKPKRRFRFRLRWVAVLLALLLVVYVGVQLYFIVVPRMKYETAITDTMTDAVTADGLVALASTPVAGSGLLYYTAQPGERVTAGAEVAQVYQDQQALTARSLMDDVAGEIAKLAQAEKTSRDSGDLEMYLNQQQSAIYELMDAVASGDYTQLGGPKSEVALAANRMLVATDKANSFAEYRSELQAFEETLKQQAKASGSITAPATGYFTPSHQQDELSAGGEELKALTAEGLQQRIDKAPAYYGENVAGHIVTDYKWSFFTVISAKEAERCVQAKADGQKLYINFPDISDAQIPVEIASIEDVPADSEQPVKLELASENINPEILQLRSAKAQIILRELTGLRVNKQALRLVDGVQGVYIKFGNNAYFRKVEVLLEDEHYVLVSDEPSAGTQNLERYDEIITDSGGVELGDGNII